MEILTLKSILLIFDWLEICTTPCVVSLCTGEQSHDIIAVHLEGAWQGMGAEHSQEVRRKEAPW